MEREINAIIIMHTPIQASTSSHRVSGRLKLVRGLVIGSQLSCMLCGLLFYVKYIFTYTGHQGLQHVKLEHHVVLVYHIIYAS